MSATRNKANRNIEAKLPGCQKLSETLIEKGPVDLENDDDGRM